MIQFTSLNDGVLVYAKNTTDDPDLGRIIELRVGNHFAYQYFAKYEGMYLPMYTLSYGDVDRTLIQLPPIESRSIYPVYLAKRDRHAFYNETPFVYFFDNLRNPQHIFPRQGAVYSINRRGFVFTSGKFRVDHEEAPVKFKIHIPNITSHGKFHMYNPDTGYLDWVVEIDGLDVYVNDVFQTTLTNENEIEMDLGFNSERLVTNFYESDDILYTNEYSDALETMPAISDSILEIEGLDSLTIDWIMCYKASFQNTVVFGSVEYTDILDLVTTGQPLLTNISKFGIKTTKAEDTQTELGLQRTVTDAELGLYGMVLKLRDSLISESLLEIKINNTLQKKHPLEVKVRNSGVYNSLMQIGVGSAITKVFETALQGAKADLEKVDELGIKLSKQNHFTEELGLQRTIAYQDDNYYGMQPTFIKDVVKSGEYSMTLRLENELRSEQMLMIMLKKILDNVSIETETFRDMYLITTIAGNGGVETQ